MSKGTYINYGVYQNARDAAWLILDDEKISTFPVPIVDICRNLGVNVKYFNPKFGEKGMITNLFGTPYIFVSPDLSKEEKRYIIAHELGHLLLRHMKDCNTLMYYDYEEKKNKIEDQASSFATRILTPACVLNGCNVRSWQEIQKLCDIPESIAKKRMKRLTELRIRNKFLTSKLEKAVYENFEDYIKKHNCETLPPDNE